MAIQLWNGVNVFKEEMVMESVLYLGGTELWNTVPRRYCFEEKAKNIVSRSSAKKTLSLKKLFDKTSWYSDIHERNYMLFLKYLFQQRYRF